jgi:transcriptional regulator with XRE-family HTH domain
MSEFTQLKLWLMKHNISQSKLANETGLHKNTISKLIRTGNGNKSVKQLVRLYLNIDQETFNNLLNLE